MESTLPDWAQEHMRYLATDGADGHIWRGVPTLLLTTPAARVAGAAADLRHRRR